METPVSKRETAEAPLQMTGRYWVGTLGNGHTTQAEMRGGGGPVKRGAALFRTIAWQAREEWMGRGGRFRRARV
jgi:hypothetical protein